MEIGDALTAAGHDFWQVDGLLNLNASSRPFTISLASIDGLIFDNSRDYTWPILHAAAIENLESSQLALDPSGFKNPLNGGHFSLESTSNDLIMHFSAIPEPASVIILLSGALFAGFRTRSKP